MFLIPNVRISVGIPPQREGWKSWLFNIHYFAEIDATTKGNYFYTPALSCNEQQWGLEIYPGGCIEAMDDRVSFVFYKLSGGGVSATFEVKILEQSPQGTFFYHPDDRRHLGWLDVFRRSDILNILDDNGTLALVISIKEEGLKPFIPKNPCQNMLQKKFLDEETSDVCFEVGSSDVAKVRTKRKRSTASVKFHAHSQILQICAPMLAALFATVTSNDGESAIASITDVEPDIFRHLLCYVYGGSVSEDVLKRDAKEIIETADKYSIVNLKLEAEAAYVESNDITVENVIDNLLYADAKNCALLKEAVLDFLAENSVEAAQNISFTDVPGHIINDLLVAFGRSKKSYGSGNVGDKYSTMRVSELRRMLDEKGLNVDGPREAMIEALKSSAAEIDI
ncbi:hypothetical protein ACHAWC_008919 [Mediolabrus comicus]